MGRAGEQKRCTKCKTGTMTWTRFEDPDKPDAWLCGDCRHEDRVWQRMKKADGRTGKDLPGTRRR